MTDVGDFRAGRDSSLPGRGTPGQAVSGALSDPPVVGVPEEDPQCSKALGPEGAQGEASRASGPCRSGWKQVGKRQGRDQGEEMELHHE